MFTKHVLSLAVVAIVLMPPPVGAAEVQHAYVPNSLVVIPKMPIAAASNSAAQFTIVVPLETSRFIGEWFVRPEVTPEVTINFGQTPPFVNTIDIKIAHSTDALTTTGITYDRVGVPVSIGVGRGRYTINYYTKSTTI